MAKGNLLQGMGRGKIGDIVLSRTNGQQISRVRNRNPKKSKTNAQLYQRAIMATVMQAYSAGKAIFDHSFQGKSVGQANMSEFLKLNAKALRQQLAQEVNNLTPEENCKAKVTAPGVKMPIPNAYIVSSGSLTNNIFNYKGDLINLPIENETVAQYLNRVGIQTDDLFTIVAFYVNFDNNIVSYSNDPYGQVKECRFGYAQFRPKASAFQSDTIITLNTPIESVFDVVKVNCNGRLDVLEAGLIDVFGVPGWGNQISVSVIRSHENSGLRSNAVMGFPGDEDFGLTYQYLLEAWSQSSVPVGDSDLILEGSGF